MPDKLIREFAIPMLPCLSIEPTLAFYQALGFVVTFQQKKPNTYAVLRLRDLEIHFFVLKGLQPAHNFCSCYLVVNGVDELYASFSKGLRSLFGKLPVRGIPRINPLKDIPAYGVRQCIIVDPSGNYIRIGQPIPKRESLVFAEDNQNDPAATPLEKAHELASRLADAKGDEAAAAKVLDQAIANADPNDAYAFLRVLILRADIANRMENYTLALPLLERAVNLASSMDPSTIVEETRLADELQKMLRER